MDTGLARIAAVVLAVAWALPGCGGTVAPDDAAAAAPQIAPRDTIAAREGSPMSAPQPAAPASPEPSDGPELTPEQVWLKLVNLIESLYSEADLNRAHVERVIGLPLAQHPGDPKSLVVGGHTTAGWEYGFDLSRFNDEDVRLYFSPYLADLDTTTKVSPTCTFPFRQLYDELVKRGFKPHEITAAADRMYWWQFSRKRLVVNTYYYFLQPQEMDETNYEQACLRRVSIGFEIPKEKLRHE